MARVPEEARRDFLVEVATLYYEQDLSQAEIARKFDVSRSLVSHLLKLCRDQGIVEIRINDSRSRAARLQRRLRELNVGNLRVERADPATMRFTLTVAKDLDCSGLPVTGETVCDYDEGFIAGIMRTYFGREFVAREIDCWASGGRICRFEVKPLAADLDAG